MVEKTVEIWALKCLVFRLMVGRFLSPVYVRMEPETCEIWLCGALYSLVLTGLGTATKNLTKPARKYY